VRAKGRGRQLGVTFLQLQLVWFLFAAGVWTVTIFLYRWFCWRLAANRDPEPAANALRAAS
jgi:hypothetical protein